MKRFGLLLFILVFITMLFSGSGLASNLQWRVYETEHFVIFFSEGYEYHAQETGYYLEKYLAEIKEFTGNQRDIKTRIVIQDVGLDSNGYAFSWSNKIGIYTTGPIDGALINYQSWLRLVAGHELTHIQHLLNYSGPGAIIPGVFGDILAPNMFVPGWIIEGITVYNESQISPYEGRLNDGYYDAILAAKAQAGKFPSILEANYYQNYFPVGQFYLFGGTFIRHLADTYGEEKLTEFFNVHGRNMFGFLSTLSPDLGIDPAARKVFGKSFEQLFKDWEEVEVAKHKNWRIDGELVIDNFRGYISNLSEYDGKLYYVRENVLTPEPVFSKRAYYLVEYNPATGKEKFLRQLPSRVLGKIQIQAEKIYYISSELKGGYANIDQFGLGTTGILMSYDLRSGKTNRILTDDIRAFTVLENGEIIYTKDRRDAHGSEIWKFIGNKKVKIGTINQSVSELVTYKDQLIMVSKENLGSWNINYLDLTDFSIEPIVDTPWAEVAISIQGDTLYYSANYGRQWAVYSYDLVTGRVFRYTEGGYAFNGLEVADKFFFIGVTAESEAIFTKEITSSIYHLGEREVILRESIAEFAATLEEKNAFAKNLSYMLIPNVRLPFLLLGGDGLGMHNYTISVSPFGGIDLAITSTLAQPLQVSLINQKISGTERQTLLSASYPLYLSSQYGLKELGLTVQTDFQDVHRATLGANFHAPNQLIDWALTGTVQGGVNADLRYKYLLQNSSLVLRASVFNNYNKVISFRDYSILTVKNGKGATMGAEYTHKLMEVRRGYWPSTLYLADVYGGIFADYATPGDGKSIVGANLKFELSMGYQLNTIPEVGFVVTDKGIKPYFGMSLGF